METAKLSPGDDSARKAVFRWLLKTFTICTEDCPSVDLRDHGDDVRLVFTSGGTASETLEWRAKSWTELWALMADEPEGCDYED